MAQPLQCYIIPQWAQRQWYMEGSRGSREREGVLGGRAHWELAPQPSSRDHWTQFLSRILLWINLSTWAFLSSACWWQFWPQRCILSCEPTLSSSTGLPGLQTHNDHPSRKSPKPSGNLGRIFLSNDWRSYWSPRLIDLSQPKKRWKIKWHKIIWEDTILGCLVLPLEVQATRQWVQTPCARSYCGDLQWQL